MTKQASAPPTPGKGAPVAPPPPPWWRHYLWLIAFVVFIGLYFVLPATEIKGPVTLNYTQFLTDVSAHKVKTVTLATNGARHRHPGQRQHLHHGRPAPGRPGLPRRAGPPTRSRSRPRPPAPASGPRSCPGSSCWRPFLVIGYFWWRLSKRGAGGGLQGVLGAGRSKAKVFDQERPKTTFADVAGYEGAKAEIAEVVDFLPAPRALRPGRGHGAAGRLDGRAARAPARPCWPGRWRARPACPFFSVTGSSFVEMFVGVGAARVRDLFSEARKQAPAIIFVDEIDAIGQRRGGAGAVVSNDEREQTLNQLLAEMDGFDPATGHRRPGRHQPARGPGPGPAAPRAASTARSPCPCPTWPSAWPS